MANVIVPLVFVGVAIIIAMMMPLFTTMNIPTSDGLELTDKAYKIFRNNTSLIIGHNITAQTSSDTAFIMAGDGIEIFTFYDNDTISIRAVGGGGGEINLGTNVGGQAGQVFRDKSGVTLNFKTISGSGGITITNNANDIDVSLGALNIEDLNNVTATGCATGQILKVSGTTWQCSADDDSGGGGNTNLLDGSVHQDTSAQAVTRGSIIYGDSTPEWNELVIGGSNTVLKSDGTDVAWSALTIGTEVTGASTALSDTANIAYLNTANVFTDSNMQTFHDDFVEFRNPANTFDYILSTGAIVADRTMTLPVLTGNSVFVFTDQSQTLTLKGISLGSNTITGTSAEFDTANSDGNFAYEGAENSWVDGITQTFNPSATESGLNVGGHTAEPSSPDDGDLFLDTTANQLKARINGAWINLGASGGSNALLDGSAHTDTVAQAVTRGSIIYGDATPNWNELVIGGSATFLRSDGTDISWTAIVSGDLPAVVVETDDVNTYSDGIKQTFNPDATEAGLNVGGHTAEPSSPDDGDLFLDTTANQLKARINGAWINLGASGGTNALLDGSIHTDTVAQAVTRGSIIYGDSTPDWNELVIGGSNTVLKSDGTDVAWSALTIGTEVTGASTALSDTANIAYLNTANVFIDTNMQTFHDDFVEFRNPANTFDYILSTGAIVADRTMTLPVLTGNSVFVFTDQSQTLTLKGISLGSNTITGTSAEFDTANSDGNFFLNADNISQMATSTTAQFNTANSDGTFVVIEVANTYSDGIKQTFNPSGTNAGLNIGLQAGEPSSPVEGDIFYDSTANQFKGRDDGAWINLGGAGGGSNALLDGSAHTDTVAQAVTRGSIIYGDSTPDWNELVVGGANTVLKSDGTDVAWSALTIGTEVTGASTALSDTADIAYLNTANVFIDTNMQTFSDDFFQIEDETGGQFYTLSAGNIAADRVMSLPVLTGNSVFVFTDQSQTLTLKGIDLSANTITGTTAEFNTANSDGTFVVIEVTNTYSDGIKQTFNPDGTNAGINLGGHTAEPSSPVDGDIFLDTTVDQLKARINGAWINLGASGGSNALLDGSAHTDTVAQAVTRGSIIYGDATPNWNELVIGTTGQMITTDGTDISWGTGAIGTEVTGASTDLTDTANIAYLNTANVWTSGTQDFGSLTIAGFDLNCDEATSSCINVDTADFIGVAEQKRKVFTCGGGMSQVTNTPNKRTEDASNLDYVVCEFDTTTAESIIWTYVMPDNFDGTGTIDVTVNVVVDTGGNTASACFDISFLGLSQDDVINSAFGSVTGACTGVIVIGDFEEATMSGIASGTHTLTAGQLAFIKLDRDVAADSNSGDVGVINIEVEWN